MPKRHFCYTHLFLPIHFLIFCSSWSVLSSYVRVQTPAINGDTPYGGPSMCDRDTCRKSSYRFLSVRSAFTSAALFSDPVSTKILLLLVHFQHCLPCCIFALKLLWLNILRRLATSSKESNSGLTKSTFI